MAETNKILPKNEFVRILNLVSVLDLSEDQYDLFFGWIEPRVNDEHGLCRWWFDHNDTVDVKMDRVVHDESELYDMIIRYAAEKDINLDHEAKVRETMDYMRNAFQSMIDTIDGNGILNS